MEKRPQEDLFKVLIEQGATITYLKKEHHLPIQIKGVGYFKGGNITINGQQSSQFISGLLMIAPLSKNPVTIEQFDINRVKNRVSKPFIDMTIKMMTEFGSKVQEEDTIYKVEQGMGNLKIYSIEPDATSSTYGLVGAAILQGQTQLHGLSLNSKQGDIKFYTEFLAKIGFDLKFTEDRLLISQVKIEDLKPFHIDFGDMTDTFMTGCIIAALIQGKSIIKGIANQKVKECNRIRAMIKNFKKLGIFCEELQDGLIIHGKPIIKSKHSKYVSIKCYKDHRIAMSFTILASFYYKHAHELQIIISDKLCVQKTYPSFYQDMQYYLGIKCGHAHSVSQEVRSPIILVGMRGCGKSSYKQLYDSKINCVDLDRYLMERENESIDSIVKQKGWDVFRHKENECLSAVLQVQNYQFISTGGGVVEHERNVTFLLKREILKYEKNTIFVLREIDDILKNMANENRPNYQQSFEDTYKQREKYFLQSKYIFCGAKRDQIQDHDLQYYKRINKIFKQQTKKLYFGEKQVHIKEESFFLCAFLDELIQNVNQLWTINKEYHALEIRLDKQKESLIETAYKCALVRYHVDIPIIFTLRTKEEGGFFEGNYMSQMKQYRKLLIFDLIDIEFSQENLRLIPKFSRATVILSKHFQSDEQVIETYNEMSSYCEKNNQNLQFILKIILKSDLHYEKIQKLQSNRKTPLILIGSGMTRVKQLFFTPVYDPRISNKTHPLQMTKEEILHTRKMLGIQQDKKYYLFRENAQLSFSPQIHNLAFDLLQCKNHHYQAYLGEQVLEVIKEKSFYGGSISMPYKQLLLDKVDFILGPIQQNINTVVKFQEKLYGFNTDYYGVYHNVKKHRIQLKSALIFGNGNTAFTMYLVMLDLGFQVTIISRSERNWDSFEKAEKFLFSVFKNKKSQRFGIILSAVPNDNDFYQALESELFDNKPVVFESNYHPRETRLVELAKQQGCGIIYGIDMLLSQAFKQVELFTGKKVKKSILQHHFQ